MVNKSTQTGITPSQIALTQYSCLNFIQILKKRSFVGSVHHLSKFIPNMSQLVNHNEHFMEKYEVNFSKNI